MKDQRRDRAESARQIVYWSNKSKIIIRDFSHERFVVPWQMDHKEKKVTVE